MTLGITDTAVSLTGNISKYLYSYNRESWEAFQNELQLDVPRPDNFNKESNKLIDKIKVAFTWRPMYDWAFITTEQFVAAICAYNFEELINEAQI